MKNNNLYRIVFVLFLSMTLSSFAGAHMPWLATDSDGHAVMWFGESPDDRTYHMPANIAAIELAGSKSTVSTEPVETDSLVGIRSEKPIELTDEISGVVTYGLYHGTILTYHVEHLPQVKSSDWPTQPRDGAALQSVITALPTGGVQVKILLDGKPAKDVDVKLFCEEGHEEGSAKTDVTGIATFSKSSVEPGLNAIVVGLTDSDARGTLDGEGYSSTTDYLTATFRIAGESMKKTQSQEKRGRPEIDDKSGVSIVPANLPDLPEELTSFGAAIADEKIYVYGGHTGDAHSYSTDEQSNRLWCLDLSAGQGGLWRSLAGGPSLQGLALVAHGNRIVRIGGFTAVNASGEDHDLRSQDDVAKSDPARFFHRMLPTTQNDLLMIGGANMEIGKFTQIDRIKLP